jgi:chromosome segregation ATPase
MELVGRLFKDLVSTTNAYKHVQEKEARILQDLSLSQAQLFPLRKENAKLARENHDLHNETIRLSDQLRNVNEDHSRDMQKLQEQLQDSKFKCESLNEKIRGQVELIDRLRLVRYSCRVWLHCGILTFRLLVTPCRHLTRLRTPHRRVPAAAADLSAPAPSRSPAS